MLETGTMKVNNFDDTDLILANGITFKRSNKFDALYTSVLYDKQLEEIKNAFNKKYNIDYFGIFCIGKNKNESYFCGHIDHEKWRDFILKEDSLTTTDPIILATAELQKGKGKLIFPDVEGYKGMNLRGEIIGEYKNPFDICMHSSISNLKWGYSITLKGLASILSIDYETYVQLRRDLQKIEPFLMPFYNYFKEFGSITDTPELQQRLKDHNFDFKI